MTRTDSSRHCVVLVHGTWSPKAAWTQVGSFFRDKLASRLGGNFDVVDFNWSGCNTQFGRRLASVRLAQWIRKERGRHATIQLVGHSHGGNVATRAAWLQPAYVTSVVTLATPFIEVVSESEDPDDSDQGVSGGPPIGVILGSIFVFAAIGSELAVTLIGRSILYAALVLLFLWLLSIPLLHKAERNYTGFGYTSVSTLVITYHLDEALSTIWMGLAVPESLMAGSRKVASGPFADNPAVGALGVSLLLFNRLVATALAAIALGPASALDRFHLKFDVGKIPDSAGDTTVRHLELDPPNGWRPRFSFRLRHCHIYSDPRTADATIEWLEEHAREHRPPSSTFF